MTTELVGWSASDLADAVRSGRASAVDVVRAHLDQLAEVEHRLGAYVTVLRREAMAAAEAVDASDGRGSLPLAGVPVAIKDVVAVAGQPTRHGSLATSPEPATADDEVVARWRAAGAVVIGITRCPELSLWGTSDDPDGTAVSPWQPTRTAGGSSGGSGAAVAAGTVALALGTDGLGSVRIPSACCGLFGIKPGGDLAVERYADGLPYWFGMSHYGPLATSVADAAFGLATMVDRPELATVAPPRRRLRVAVSWAPPAPGVVVTRPWIDAAAEAGRVLRHVGHDIAHDDPPYEPATVGAAVLRWTQAAHQDLERLVVAPERLQPRTLAHARAGERTAHSLPVDESQALRWRERVDPFLERYDVLITPMFAKVQPKAADWHRRGWLQNVTANLAAYPFAAPWNLADVPAASVPIGSHGGAPLAVQIVGRRGGEAMVLAVAAELERSAPWVRHPPGWGVAGTS
ncbi:MAG: amidase [Nitriliruptor sp.]|uniref:amidase n=1 Tax=Nitriliruptor sp. TaxID=2448056 RepID=UPI00349FE978